MNFDTARAQMLGQQLRAWDVLDDKVLEAIRVTPREYFAPLEYRELAFADTEIPLGHGQHMLAPKIEGRLLQALQIASIDDALLVGTGSGYLCACLSRLAQHVVSVDVIAEFTAAAQDKFTELGIANVELETADGLSLEAQRRYDVIAVTASIPELDERFINMLRPRGRLFIVVGRAPIMEARLITMHPGGEWTQESLFETMLTPLANLGQTERFVL
jgi:protein-L-isoaspartate(D-aspartate) O-methyltransferase